MLHLDLPPSHSTRIRTFRPRLARGTNGRLPASFVEGTSEGAMVTLFFDIPPITGVKEHFDACLRNVLNKEGKISETFDLGPIGVHSNSGKRRHKEENFLQRIKQFLSPEQLEARKAAIRDIGKRAYQR